MSGFGVLAWIVIGSVVGWTVSRLMVGAEDDALRGTAAGLIGAILGGLAVRLLDSGAPGTHQLNGTVAALAGSLWLTWSTCVVTSGRRRDRGRAAGDAAAGRARARTHGADAAAAHAPPGNRVQTLAARLRA